MLTKQERLSCLETVALNCRKCPHLAATRTEVVFGIGNPDAEIMFVGEAPGEEEDRQGKPFVGPAGQLLTYFIRKLGFKRADVYIANILKCQPNATEGNRKPELSEMETCLPYLRNQARIIQPRVIVAMGNTAVEGLLGIDAPITRIRGMVRKFEKIPVVLTYHPAYVLRNPTREVRTQFWEDLCRALEEAGYDASDRIDRVPVA